MTSFPWLELAKLIGQSIPVLFTQGELFIIIVVVILLVHMQYRRIAMIERRMYGVALSDPVRNTAVGFGYGLLGGLVATLLFVVLGISLTDVGVVYLWLLAILLMTIHPRFLCFSYAGGLLSATYLLFGWPQLNVPAVMALVAILHLVESVLILVHGAKNATPVYVRRQDGRVVGGFTLQKFWPMPFIALIAFMFLEATVGEATLAMPDWWPLIRPLDPAPEGYSYVYVLYPVIAALGYGDIAITRTPRVKARRTAGYLLVYSVVLMLLALAGGLRSEGEAHAVTLLWQWVAAFFAVAGHEAVIHLGRRAEETGPPLYDAGQGAVVLDVVPDSPAAQMGLTTGDVIRTLNGYPVSSGWDLRALLTPWVVGVTIEVDRIGADGKVEQNSRRTVRYPGKLPPFGVILAPGPGEPALMSLEESGRYGVALRRLGRRIATLFRRLVEGPRR